MTITSTATALTYDEATAGHAADAGVATATARRSRNTRARATRQRRRVAAAAQAPRAKSASVPADAPANGGVATAESKAKASAAVIPTPAGQSVVMTGVENHRDYLYGYALRRLGDPELADDLVQEASLAALRAKPTFQGKSSERTWYVGILKHKIIDHYRRRRRERTMSSMDDGGDAGDMLSAAEHRRGRSAEDEPIGTGLERGEFWASIDRAVQKLPPRVARAFRMYELEKRPSEEITEELGVTSSNLWVMLHRARKALRGHLDPRWLAGQE